MQGMNGDIRVGGEEMTRGGVERMACSARERSGTTSVVIERGNGHVTGKHATYLFPRVALRTELQARPRCPRWRPCGQPTCGCSLSRICSSVVRERVPSHTSNLHPPNHRGPLQTEPPSMHTHVF